jgi:N-acetyl-anhydromuramyl-L-alanine amidase AmpD
MKLIYVEKIMGITNKIKDMVSSTPKVIDTPDTIKIQPLEERKIVDIIVDKQIRTKYQQGWINKIRKNPITEICIHNTGGGTSANGILYWMMLGERAAEYYKGEALFHYLIDRDKSNIVEVIDPSYWVYHSSSGAHDKETVGIEMVNPSKGNREAPTENQYVLLFNLIFKHLLPTYSTIKSIVSHDHNMQKYSRFVPKGCPGPGFDWVRLEKEFLKNKINFNKKGVGEYEIA